MFFSRSRFCCCLFSLSSLRFKCHIKSRILFFSRAESFEEKTEKKNRRQSELHLSCESFLWCNTIYFCDIWYENWVIPNDSIEALYTIVQRFLSIDIGNANKPIYIKIAHIAQTKAKSGKSIEYLAMPTFRFGTFYRKSSAFGTCNKKMHITRSIGKSFLIGSWRCLCAFDGIGKYLTPQWLII